jgi:hypothetical protein
MVRVGAVFCSRPAQSVCCGDMVLSTLARRQIAVATDLAFAQAGGDGETRSANGREQTADET